MIGVETWLSRSQGLIAALGDAGLPTGLGEQLKVLRLLQLLEERGGAPKTADELARWVTPLMCSRSDQFEPLRRVLNARFVEKRTAAVFERFTAGEQKPQKRRYSLAWPAAIAAVIALIGAAFYYLVRNSNLVPNFGNNVLLDTPTPNLSSALIHPGVTATVLTLIVGYLLWRRINLAVRHGRVTGEGTARQVRLDEPEQDKDNPLLLRAARMLNRPQLRPTGKLDVPGTVRATAEAGGRFSPTELIRRVPASWMLLAERGGEHDPTPEFGARLSLLLSRSGVRHSLYEFRRSPEWVLRKSARDGPEGLDMPLERALATDRPTRVLMLAEAASVVDERTGGPARWLNDYDVPSPVLLTPNAMENWSAKEASAAQAGVLVLPANPAGLTSLARRIQADDLAPSPFAPTKEAQFEQWQAERFTWLSQTEPEPEERKKLVDTLKTLLGAKEFRLLVGVAAFPEVRLDLMATLDRKLHPGDTASEQRFRLLTLGRLVWLKETMIPDWLRQDLMRALPPREVRELREAWADLLADKPAPGKPGTTLAIHLAEDTAEAGAQGDGLFLGFMRGEFDLPAPLRWKRGLTALLRAPDRTELFIAALGVGAAVASFLGEIDIRAQFEQVLSVWYAFMRQVQESFPSLLSLRLWMLAIVFASAIRAVGRVYFVLQGQPVPFDRFLPRPVDAIVSGVIVVAAGWLGVDFRSSYYFYFAASDFSAPLIVAVGVVLLHLWPLRPARQATVELHAITQKGRGTGLSDRATMLALLWLFSAGILLDFVVYARDVWQELANGWLVAIAVLGLARAMAIWWSDAQLQPFFSTSSGATRDSAIGLLLGQLSGAAFARILTANVQLFGTPAGAGGYFVSWHLGVGLMLFGSAAGVSAALWRHGLIKNTAILWAGMAAFTASVAQASLLAVLGPKQYPSLSVTFGQIPIALLVLLASVGFRRTAALNSVLPIVAAIFALEGFWILAQWTWSGFLTPTGADWVYALPLVAAVVVMWPLIQRSVTDEPSVASEPAEWRPRPAYAMLWLIAPLVLLTAVQPSIGPIALDLPSLVIPLAIALAWRFGLRGYRTVLLMVLPALWYYVPYLLTWVNFAPLQAILPAPKQYALPQWFVPLTLDAAASALLIAALFARPALFAKIRATTQLPWWGVGVLILVLCIQVSVPGDLSRKAETPPGPIDVKNIAQVPATDEQLRNLTDQLKRRGVDNSVLQNISPKADVPTGNANVAAPSNTLKSDPRSEKAPDRAPTAQAPIQQQQTAKGEAPPVGASGGGNFGPGPASSFGFRVSLGWSSETLLVVTLFLFAISRAHRQAILVLSAIGVAGVASLALVYSGLSSGVFRPLPVSTPIVALIAYAIGRYFARISIESAGSFTLRDHTALAVLFIGMFVAIQFFFSVPWVVHYAFAADIQSNLVDGGATFISLSLLMAWTMGVRVGSSAWWRTAGVVSFLLFGIFWLLLFFTTRMFLFFSDPETTPLLLGSFLPLVLFIVGTRCREAVVRPAQEPTAATIPEPQNQWLATLRRWFASISDRVRPAARTTPTMPSEDAPAGTGPAGNIASDTNRPPAGSSSNTAPTDSGQIAVSSNNPCPFLRALVAGGYIDGHVAPILMLSRTTAPVGSEPEAKVQLGTFLIALIANGLNPMRLLQSAFSGVKLDGLRNGPLDKHGAGSRILDVDAQVHLDEIERLAAFGRACVDPSGGTEHGLTAKEIETFMAANLARAGDAARWYYPLLMKGEWPLLLEIMGKGEGEQRYLSMAEVRALFVEQRLPERIIERLNDPRDTARNVARGPA